MLERHRPKPTVINHELPQTELRNAVPEITTVFEERFFERTPWERPKNYKSWKKVFYTNSGAESFRWEVEYNKRSLSLSRFKLEGELESEEESLLLQGTGTIFLLYRTNTINGNGMEIDKTELNNSSSIIGAKKITKALPLNSYQAT